MPQSSRTEDTMTLLEIFAMVENGKIKNAAAALFTKRPQSYPQFTLRMAFRKEERLEIPAEALREALTNAGHWEIVHEREG